ncbi:Formimidoyltetrahydrofolate cyclodeaminase [Carboxydocella sporoproducens DSM 16521]|uniref:Formimidoyltetrahydrofolate cyclodeaminase n=2 Tax=Carboxydocella TaxID=178898 RepID=A0A1T4NHM8_9FIRM|nr:MULTISPECIES: cyclodeaminase/cyclohydrolase family protein [Carboxydocella]AVX20044.1 Formimidoyltetrahydrofolate cyclodeaminase [Carboxydocella thermautotrophica]AVX30461.1 Formimidoyltetrahydrofolate cyclodeaminase [Carboxydocella thermautotrophica]SJZ78623.1 Formimidoyltetrahydrofolate cyclodeaminase [Carboxydocella sporoproducens DSM 16521]
MSHVFDLSVREFLKVAASDSPTPGGGSVSALVGSLAASMVSMVANLTVGKEKYKDVEPEVKEILQEIQAVMARLEQLTAQDIKEFGNFMEVLKMPKNTEEEKALRAAKMQEALKSATDTPLEIARVCLKALELADRLSGIGNKGAISDVGVGAYVAEAALNAVLLSVDINLPMIKDEAYVAQAKAERDQLVARARELKEKAVAVVQSRLA